MKKIYHFSDSDVAGTGYLAALPEDIRRRLLKHGRSRQFAKGELIQQRGDAGGEFWYIQSGSVQIGRYSVDGKLNIFALLAQGASFGEQAFLGEFPRMVDAIAGSDAILIQIGEAEFQRAIASDASVARILLKAMAHMLQHTFDLLEAGRSLTAVQRLAQALIRFCKDGDREVTVPVTQQELADLIGVSRVTLGKALEKLEQSACIERQYGKIIVRDQPGLRQIASS